MKNGAKTVNVCHYQVKPGREAEMEALLAKHWPALHGAGLTTDEPAVTYRGLPSDKPDQQHGAARVYIEIFSWKSDDSAALAHQMPEVMAVWEPMGAICESMDFPTFELLDLLGADE